MKRIVEIDILRAFATALLLLHHAGIYQFEVYGVTLKILLSTQIGLALIGIFVFLSGFLLGHYFKHNPNVRLRDYYIRRVARLYPPYIVSLILFQVLLSVQLESPDFWYHFFGLQILLAPAFSVPIFTLWYFGLLIAFLLIIPIGLHKCNKIGPAILYLISAFFLAYILHEKYQIIEIRFFYYYWVFSLGGLIGRWNTKHTKLLSNPLILFMSLTILVLTGYRLFRSQNAYLVDLHWGHISWATAYMLSFVHLTYFAATKFKRLRWGERLTQLISRGSYFTYMFHRPVWSIMLIPLPIAEGPITFIIQFFIGSPLVIYLSGKLQPLYERAFVSRFKVSDKPSS
ncbi:MAG: acyltransferase [Chloroflexota bacterium]|nr:acyltransferase [Chloroflexota bacterium]